MATSVFGHFGAFLGKVTLPDAFLMSDMAYVQLPSALKQPPCESACTFFVCYACSLSAPTWDLGGSRGTALTIACVICVNFL